MGKTIQLCDKYLKGYVEEKDFLSIMPALEECHKNLACKNVEGKDFLGWIDLPTKTENSVLDEMIGVARDINGKADALIVIGIGGSYLGARAAIETLAPEKIDENIFFAGYNLSGDYLAGLLDKLQNRDVAINVISKSGTTTEPAIAFRIIESFLETKYGTGKFKDRVICTTDKESGALRKIAKDEGYRSFVIPDDIGGRFSVLTSVGLFPMACAGIDIKGMINGAREAQKMYEKCDINENMSYRYAVIRNILYNKGKRIEILSSFDNGLHYVDEWWKQLFGESEGKQGHSIFPASCDFSTDLHSMGQLIQDGERNLFETFLIIEKDNERCVIPNSLKNQDNLNYLSNKQMDYVNKKAYEATKEAHYEGGVPNITLRIPEKDSFCIGNLFYFFEKAAAVSGYLFGVNPFDQPGVESYKNKMFKLLGKPSK